MMVIMQDGQPTFFFTRGSGNAKQKDSFQLFYELSHEHTNTTFKALNQYRQAEFFQRLELHAQIGTDRRYIQSRNNIQA